MDRFRGMILSIVVSAVFPVSRAIANEVADERLFETHVRPVLAAHCLSCHGPDKQESGFRLDSRAALLKGGDRGAAIVPGKPEDSPLVEFIRRSGETKMPPAAPLSGAQVAAIEEWIRRGAVWPTAPHQANLAEAWKTHWAFQPIASPFPPAVTASHPLDAFVAAKQAEHQLPMAPLADRRTRLRRLSYTLRGLPPSAEDLADFTADESPDAWERWVDRYLTSPQYGERWARIWLDVARYADTKGYVFFEDRSYPWAYTYRDYVITALNRDVPYQRFIEEQLAGDLLSPIDDRDPRAGLGFLTLGSHFMGNVHDITDDRMDVALRGIMGLTFTCARCHDHKFDPISQADYYGLYGVLRSSEEPLVAPALGDRPLQEESEYFEQELALRRAHLDEFVRGKHTAMVNGARTRIAEYLLAAFAADDVPPTDDFMLIADPDDLNPAMIVRYEAYLDRWKTAFHPVWSVWWQFAKLPPTEFAQQSRTLCEQLAKNPAGQHPLILERLCAAPPTSLAEVAQRFQDLLKSAREEWEQLPNREQAGATLSDPQREVLRQELYGPNAPANVPLVFGWGFLSLLPDRAAQGEFQRRLREVEQWLINGPTAPARAMALQEAAEFSPRVFQRGNPSRPGAEVPRGWLRTFAYGGDFQHGSGRREWAAAMVSEKNPLTARVIVNRVWQTHFGTGLVRTPGDFGLRSDPPTHPELLDYLATELIRHDWSLKWLQRFILTSSTFQQTSHADESERVDPDNRWLARFARRRLDLESWRDSVLSAADGLNDRLGGPSVSLWVNHWEPRRSVYAYVDRQDLPNLFSVFDFPSPAATSAQRDTTTIAPQALYQLNGPLVLAAAERVWQRPELQRETERARRIDALYRVLYGRTATDQDQRLLSRFLGEADDPARWIRLIHGLLLTNEFGFLD